MNVKIVYCVPCGFLPKALDLEKEILNRYGQRLLNKMSVSLVPSGGGVFDVFVNEELVFSRKASGGRFPSMDDLLPYLEQATSSKK